MFVCLFVFSPETVLKQDTLLLYNPKECRGAKRVCPFFLLENSRPLSPWGPLDFLSTCLGTDSLMITLPPVCPAFGGSASRFPRASPAVLESSILPLQHQGNPPRSHLWARLPGTAPVRTATPLFPHRDSLSSYPPLGGL